MNRTGSDTPLQEQLHRHVEEVRDAARAIPTLTLTQRAALVERTLDTLRSLVVPHARDEARSVHAKIGDHAAIEALVDDLASIDTGDPDRLQEVLYGLYALVSVQLGKNERLYAPLLRGGEESWHPDEVDYDAPVLLHEP